MEKLEDDRTVKRPFYELYSFLPFPCFSSSWEGSQAAKDENGETTDITLRVWVRV